MNLKTDLFPLFRKKTIIFRESYKEVGDIHTFVFDYKQPLTWVPGQHAMFFLSTRKQKTSMHIFSITSIPNENFIMISTRIKNNPSEYKQALLDLKKGDSVTIRGPIASFYLKQKKPTLLIAAGIGITPYRSILLDLYRNKEKNPLGTTLFYLDSNQEYAYKNLLETFNISEHIVVDYFSERDAMNQAIIDFINTHQNNACYFIAGPKAMEQTITSMLKDHKILNKNINKDSFIGY